MFEIEYATIDGCTQLRSVDSQLFQRRGKSFQCWIVAGLHDAQLQCGSLLFLNRIDRGGFDHRWKIFVCRSQANTGQEGFQRVHIRLLNARVRCNASSSSALPRIVGHRAVADSAEWWPCPVECIDEGDRGYFARAETRQGMVSGEAQHCPPCTVLPSYL